MSSDSRWLPRRAERAWLWLAVAALHALLLFTLRDALLPQGRGKPPVDAPSLTVRLMPPPLLPRSAPAARVASAAKPSAPHAVASTPPAEQAAPQPGPQSTGQAITSAAITTPAAVATPASAAASRPLDLRRALAAPARPTLRDQMLNDPRSNSPPVTVESRVATVAGSIDISTERMDDTRTRVRQRGKCIEVHASRNAQLDPYNQSVAPTPKVVKPSC